MSRSPNDPLWSASIIHRRVQDAAEKYLDGAHAAARKAVQKEIAAEEKQIKADREKTGNIQDDDKRKEAIGDLDSQEKALKARRKMLESPDIPVVIVEQSSDEQGHLTHKLRIEFERADDPSIQKMLSTLPDKDTLHITKPTMEVPVTIDVYQHIKIGGPTSGKSKDARIR